MKINRSQMLMMGAAAIALLPGRVHAQSTQTAPPGAAPDASAQKATEDTLSDIVVTAERRETRLQETPVSASVLSGDTLKTQQIVSVVDLSAALPNVNVGVGLGGSAQVNIRGIGYSDLLPGGEARVAYYVDNFYLARPSSALGSFFDVDRVEVLRGPQGTLFGRNATGGAFNVITRSPTREASGYLDLTVGNYGLIQTEGALSGGLSDTLSARVAFQTVNRNGYGKSLITDRDIDDSNTISLRGKLRWEPSSRVTIDLSGHYHRENDANYALHYFGQGQPGTPLAPDALGYPTRSFSRDVNFDTDVVNKRETYGFDGKAKFELTDELTLAVFGAYENAKFNIVNDGDGTAFLGVRTEQADASESYSAEAQLLGDFGRLNFVAGVYYFQESEVPLNRAVINAIFLGGANFTPQGAVQTSNLQTYAGAIYGQATYKVTDKLSLTLGGRYGRETKKDIGDFFQFDLVRPWPPFVEPLIPLPGFPFDQKRTVSKFTPKVTLDYKFTPDIYAYATYSEGFKSGGFNFGQAAPNYFQPEAIKDYEGGIKTTFANGRLIVNLSGFYYNYTNIQTQILKEGTGGTPDHIEFTNAGAARIYGTELEVTARPVRGLTIDVSGSLLSAKYTEYMDKDATDPAKGTQDLRGRHVPQAPGYKVNVGAAYKFNLGDGSLTLRGEVQAVGKTYFSPFNSPALVQDAYTMGNAFLTYDRGDGHWTASVFVRNIGDTFTKSGLFNQAGFLGSGVVGANGPPRTFGVTLGYKF
jgi:iron complex outermembrane receptor protein